MDTAIDKTLTTFHLSLNVSDLPRSIEFYQKLFGMPPAKRRADYAKFELEKPPLTLSLEPSGASRGGALNHVGIRLPDPAELVELQRRLEMVGLNTIREEGVECCYARQTKFWLSDPDKTLWEFYVLESDVECAPDRTPVATVTLSAGAPVRQSARSEVAKPAMGSDRSPDAIKGEHLATDWEHRLGDGFPRSLPFAERSLNEVRLRGTFNVPQGSAARREILAECLRVLQPGGRLVLHHLTGERPLPADSLPLPGPAAVVEQVPVDAEILGWLEEAGFSNVRLIKFAGAPSFSVRDVELRETIVEARRPHDAATCDVQVVYKGPFRSLSDDRGRVYHRGERLWISEADWTAICAGPLAESFVRLRSERPIGPV